MRDLATNPEGWNDVGC